MSLQHAEHLATPVPIVLMPVIFLDVKIHCSTQTGLSVSHFKVGLLVPLKDQQLLFPYVQPKRSVTVLERYPLVFLSEAFFTLWFVSKIGGMLSVFCTSSTIHIPVNLWLYYSHMALIFLSGLLALHSQHILYFILPDIMFQSLEAE